MYERKHDKVIRKSAFYWRLGTNFFIGALVIILSLILGILGYIYFEGMTLIDAYLNAAMILSGMGPIAPLKSEGGKLFAGIYALFSGVIFLVVIAILFAPIFHRFLHKFHTKDLG